MANEVLREYDYTNPQASENLIIEVDGTPDKTVVIVSPCRSGSTALLKALSMDDSVDGVFQPMKTSLRRYMVGDDAPVEIRAEKPFMVIKETLGPYVPAEVYFRPLSVLRDRLDVNQAAGSVAVIAMLRDPEDCFNSWNRWFSLGGFPDFRPKLLEDAYQETLDVLYCAQHEGIQCVSLEYNDLNDPVTLSKALSSVGLPFSEQMIDWRQAPAYKEGQYGFQKPKEPDLFRISGLLESVKNGTGLVVGDHQSSDESKSQFDRINDIYRQFLSIAS